MPNVRRLLALGLTLGLAFASATAAAEPTSADRETTRALLAEGDRLVAAKDLPGALRAYEGAAALITVPTTVIEVGRMQEALGKLVEARDSYLRASRLPITPGEPAPFAAAREEASELASKLAGRIPSLVIAVEGAASPTVVIDDAELPPAAALLPRKVNPGRHTVRVVASGFKEARAEATVAEGESRTIPITLEADSAAPIAHDAPPVVHESPPPTLLYVGFGVGAAGLAVGTIFGLLSLSRASDAEDHCVANHCTPEAQPHKDAAIDLANVSNVGMAVALVGAGVGIYGLVTRPKARTTSWLVTPLGARGTF